MLNTDQIESLLSDTSLLLDKLSKLNLAVNNVEDVSHSLAKLCSDLKPKHARVAQDVERLRRLQEVLQGFVFGPMSLESSSTTDNASAQFDDSLLNQVR